MQVAKTVIGTGDVVRHLPTGETWIVACVSNGKLSWCGWPEGMADLADCVLVEKATPEQRATLLVDLAAMSGSDHRKSFALGILAQTSEAPLER